MEESVLSRKNILLGMLFSLPVIIIVFLTTLQDSRTKIVFCDVGQGDGIYMRIRNKIDVLIDTGADRKILNCLGKHMPFYDRKIELVFITHPQKDHMGGLNLVFPRYQIDHVFIPPVKNDSLFFKEFRRFLLQKKTRVSFPVTGTKIQIGESGFLFFWPSKEFLKQNLVFDRENDLFGSTTSDLNEFSLIFTYQEGLRPKPFRALFTGDTAPVIEKKILEETIKSNGSDFYKNISPVDILKVPHHGSKNGLTPDFLKLADPTSAVISAGKKNSYGHPHKEILDMLKASGVKVRRTDTEGDIIITVKNEK